MKQQDTGKCCREPIPIAMRVFFVAPGESWIVDRFAEEWRADNADIATDDIREADAVFLAAEWCWRRVAPFLPGRRVLTWVHHIVPEKFGPAERRDFAERDALTTAYVVPNYRTRAFVSQLTSRPVHVVPYWGNDRIWFPNDKRAMRDKHGLPQDAFIVSSFQRDSEGHDTSLPKLEKGADLLADALIHMHEQTPAFLVLLAGWRRQYVINRLSEAGVPFVYRELPSQQELNELYACTDLYPVTARHEGGPQSLVECGLVGVPVVSRPVGIAEQVLPASAINDDVTLAVPAVPNVDAMRVPHGYEPYRRLLQGRCNK